MEELALSQNTNLGDKNNETAKEEQQNMSQGRRKEKSRWSVYQLYIVCAEKILGLALTENPDLSNVTVSVVKGLTKIVSRYQHLVFDLDSEIVKQRTELSNNQTETQQVLEAAEHLEQTNQANLEKVSVLERDNQ